MGESLLAALMPRDNGEAGAIGQPPPEAFPKGFARRFCGGVAGFAVVFAGVTPPGASGTGRRPASTRRRALSSDGCQGITVRPITALSGVSCRLKVRFAVAGSQHARQGDA